MDFQTVAENVSASRQKIAIGTFNMTAGEKLKINVTGQAGQLLDWTAPAGSTCVVQIQVIVNETDS